MPQKNLSAADLPLQIDISKRDNKISASMTLVHDILCDAPKRSLLQLILTTIGVLPCFSFRLSFGFASMSARHSKSQFVAIDG